MTPLELKIALRSLRKSPGLVAISILSLGLGIGLNTTLFAIFRTVVLKGPTAADAERLVRIEPGNGNRIAYANFRDLRPGDAFAGLAAYSMTRFNRRSEAARPVPGMLISPRFFDVLQAKPAVGRVAAPGEETAVVITATFAAANGVTPGSEVELNGRSYTVVGILPEDFRSIEGALGPDVYVPVSRQTAPALDRRDAGVSFTLLGRLATEVSRQRAAAFLTAQNRELERLYPNVNEGLGRPALLFPVSGLGSWATRGAGPGQILAISAIPFALFGILLLISCANVAGLLVARGAGRSREIAIRLALGASRWQVIRALLAESAWLSLFGSTAGLLLAVWLCAILSTVALPQMPRPVQIRPDSTLLLYAMGAAAIATLFCGITPALVSTRTNIGGKLKQAETGPARFRIRNALVVGQAALSVLLLFVSVLFLRSLVRITSVNPGFDLDHTATAHIELDRDYPQDRYFELAERARGAAASMAGVQSATVASLIPLGGDSYTARFQVLGRNGSVPVASFMSVGPDYFRTMGIALRRGREFTAADRLGAAPVAIVNETFVRQYQLGEKALGTGVRLPREPWMEIAGVVADSDYSFYGETRQPILYRPFLQNGGNLFVIIRGGGSPARLTAPLALAAGAIDAHAIVEARTMRDATSLERSLRKMGSAVLGTLGALGLLLAAIGLYGVMAYRVQRRTPELGIRMALGASGGHVLRMVLAEGLKLIGGGVAAGMLLSLAAARPLASFMGGISTFDPLSILGTSAALLLAGLAASWAPARRATRVAPMAALRND